MNEHNIADSNVIAIIAVVLTAIGTIVSITIYMIKQARLDERRHGMHEKEIALVKLDVSSVKQTVEHTAAKVDEIWRHTFTGSSNHSE